MKKETIKEFGKLIYDFAKIGLAVAVITPLAKGEHNWGQSKIFYYRGGKKGSIVKLNQSPGLNCKLS